jgi:IS30 family transposase
MGRPYTQLTQTERERIEQEVRMGKSIQQIGRALKRAASTIGRELRRNVSPSGLYRALHAQKEAVRRRRVPRRLWILQTQRQRENVLRRLSVGHSPEQIAGRCPHLGSRSSLYRHLSREELSLWRRHLRGVHGKRRSDRRRERIHHRVFIDDRPEEANGRERIGDWEVDTIRGPTQSPVVLVSAVDRRTRLLKLGKAPSRKAAALNEALCEMLSGLPVYTLTVDNGMEFASHVELAQKIGAPVYFAHEHSPWERGSNENTNGLVRFYIPKLTPIDCVSDAQIARIERRLNRRPRKCLGFRTPEEVARGASLLHLQ